MKEKGKRKKEKGVFKRFKLVPFFTFCLFTFSLTLTLACGKRRPPQPPVERVPQRTELLSGVQRGNQVILSWPAPLRNASPGSVQSISRIDIYRLAETPEAQLALTEEAFASRSTLIGSVDLSKVQPVDGTITYIDTLELAGQPTRLRYALRYVNASGQRASFSNFLLIEPAAVIALPPTLLAPAEETESAITLRWRPPQTNIDGSTPVNLLGYNVYRVSASQTETAQVPLNAALIPTPVYVDKNFKFGEQYSYLVRSVSLGTGGAQVESLNSNSLTVAPRDIYRPSAPTSVSTAAAPRSISLFFPANPEPDVAGYTIYRSTDPSVPKEQWTRLNPALLTRNTFQDETVEAGKKYYYYVTATDTSGNESAPSDPVSETVP